MTSLEEWKNSEYTQHLLDKLYVLFQMLEAENDEDYNREEARPKGSAIELLYRMIEALEED